MGRRRGKTEKPKPFAEAFKGIDDLEYRVIHHLAEAKWDAEQCMRWLFSDRVVDLCQEAYPFVQAIDRAGSYEAANLKLPLMGPGTALVLVDITVALREHLPMLCPHDDHLEALNGERFYPIRDTMLVAYQHHLQFEKVRAVVRWLNEWATVGAARHYCPWLGSVLPDDHAFHQTDGLTFKEPAMSMIKVMGMMRECGTIMASALLCGEITGNGKNAVSVQFNGMRDNMKGSKEPYTSNDFGLL